ncbi:hypothetical protein [Alkalihalobacillus sp. TS-13]|uniref:hypothetical protein n=1 Tax=Alkalihalobacillus sp. TS-13 TaxID=2842455 RepID=UPI001C88885E|nr:hypothetical protein [Alkalihalobacillus sp. TS-13]
MFNFGASRDFIVAISKGIGAISKYIDANPKIIGDLEVIVLKKKQTAFSPFASFL